MKLSSLLSPDLVCVGKSFGSKNEIIEELVREVFRRRKIPLSREVVQSAVFERESLGGTVFPSGIATPHARLEGFNDLLIAVCVPASPILEGEVEIGMLVLLLTSKTAPSLYLNTLAAFLKISQDEPFFNSLRASVTAQDYIRILKDANVEVRKELTVQSIMSQTFPSLMSENSVKNAADLFYKNKTSYLPVLDREGVLIGELTVLDLFRIGIPDYASKIGSLKFLKSFEPFDDLLQREEQIRVKDVMKTPSVTLEEESPVVDAILKFTQTNRRHIPVVRGNRLAGILNYMDILHKVLRA